MRVIFASILAALILLPQPAAKAFATPKTTGNISAEEETVAADFRDFASSFGQDHLAFIGKSEQGTGPLVIEYLSEGASLEDWERMVTIHVLPIPEDTDIQTYAHDFILHFRNQISMLQNNDAISVVPKNFAAAAKAATTPSEGENADQESAPLETAIYHYAVGLESPTEDNAGIIYHDEKNIINIMVQRRNGLTVSEDEMQKLKAIFVNIAGQPPAAPPTQP